MNKFTTETKVYNSNGVIDAAGATDVEFYNGGTSIATINNRPLLPNQWWAINGFPFEQNTGKYQVEFVGGAGVLAVTRRTYQGSARKMNV